MCEVNQFHSCHFNNMYVNGNGLHGYLQAPVMTSNVFLVCQFFANLKQFWARTVLPFFFCMQYTNVISAHCKNETTLLYLQLYETTILHQLQTTNPNESVQWSTDSLWWFMDGVKWSIDALKWSTDALQWSMDALKWSTDGHNGLLMH